MLDSYGDLNPEDSLKVNGLMPMSDFLVVIFSTKISGNRMGLFFYVLLCWRI